MASVDVLRVPDEEPDLDTDSLGDDDLRVSVKMWVLWWACRQDAPDEKSARAALVVKVGQSVRREYRRRWVKSAFGWLYNRPSSLKDQNAVREMIADKQLQLASSAQRAACQAIPDAWEMSRLEGTEVERLSKVASNLGTLALRGFEGAAKLMHLDKLPPDVELSDQQLDDLMVMLPRVLSSLSPEQLDQLSAMVGLARGGSEVDDTASRAGL